MVHIGLDAGSVSVKAVVLDSQGRRIFSAYERHKGQPLHAALRLLKAVMSNESIVTSDKLRTDWNKLRVTSKTPPAPKSDSLLVTRYSSSAFVDSALVTRHFSLSVTGSAGRLIGSILEIEPVNEVVAFSYATRSLYPEVRTIIELGGEDSKLILLSDNSSAAKDFSMNSVCAAGTGSFLDQQAERLELTIEEFSRLSLDSKKPPRIAGRCSVFAKSDMIHLQQIATPVADICAGLCFAVARNFKGTIARGRALEPPVSFQGGVAANQGMLRAFREVFGIGQLAVPEEHSLMGAIGAALKDRDAGKTNAVDLSRLEEYLSTVRPSETGHRQLVYAGDGFKERHLKNSDESSETSNEAAPANDGCSSLVTRCSLLVSNGSLPVPAFLGIDIGSISTNLAVIDSQGRLLAKRYLMTAGKPIEAVRRGLAEISEEIGGQVRISGVGTTGSGRYMIADYVGADIVRNEITAQATAAAFIDKEVDTIFEIGGQDSKYISLKDGVIVDFEMNKACAAGTGSFLEEQAEKLSISVKKEFQETAFCALAPCRLGERCTVFMENSLIANLQRGTARQDLLAGLAYSIVQNYLNRVVCRRPVGRKIFFQGGVAFNKAVVAAFEKYLGKEIIVPPHHDVTGAIGMALIARDHMAEPQSAVNSRLSTATGQETGTTATQQPEKAAHEWRLSVDYRLSTFKGFDLAQRPYEISSFTCNGCSNVCEINRVKVEGEEGLLCYGGRCEKYDVRKKKAAADIPDLFGLRERLLWKDHLARQAEHGRLPTVDRRLKIGIPYIFYFHDYLPYWTTLLWKLGFDVEVSPKTDREIIDIGQETVLAETCFPVKAALGHIRWLISHGVDAVFVPSFVNMNAETDPHATGFGCPYTQTMPYSARVAFPDAMILAPVINAGMARSFLKKELLRLFRPFGIKSAALDAAISRAEASQYAFSESIRAEGRKVLASLTQEAVVITGRAYNSFDPGMNLNIPKKLASLNVTAIPMDFLPLEEEDISGEWPNMYWRAGQRILRAARLITKNPLLHAVHIGNFSCGPDSFILKFFEEELAGKPYLHLELDAHSADAGAITRCEAFLDSVRSRMAGGYQAGDRKKARPMSEGKEAAASIASGRRGRTVFIPLMSDHAYALEAAFRFCGIDAEVLPESTEESVELGKRFVSGKECYPCAVTTGDMVRKATSSGFDPEQSAFFMPSGTGPCRFGQYNVFHRLVLRDMGLDNTPVFSPNQSEHFYRELGVVGKDFVKRSWEGIVSLSLLQKCLHRARPYEQEPGSADRLYDEYLTRTRHALSGKNGALTAVLAEARQEFGRLPRRDEKRPLIGIVGEIFVRSNRFSNEDLVRKIEALGGEAYLTPVEEWVLYINEMGITRLLNKREWSGIITLLLKRFVQKRIEHRYAAVFRDFLETADEPDTGEIIRKAAPYLHPSFEGEAILSIGKTVDLIGRGAAGIVNAMPFGCMPGTIVSGLLRGVQRKYGIPCLSIPYDGTASLTTEIQLEAFLDQAKEFSKNGNE